MNNYYCEICDYSTAHSSNWCIHKKSKKHQQNVLIADFSKTTVSRNIHKDPETIISKGDLKVSQIKCDFCGMEFAYKNGLSKHKKTCLSKELKLTKLENENKLVQQENSLMKQRMTDMEKIIDSLRDTLHESVKEPIFTNSGSFSLTGTLYGELKNNPALKEIEYKEIENYIKPNSKLVREIMACYRDQTLHEFLGNFILYRVKKKNLHEQSIFASDTSRQTYYIKELILKNQSIWVLDKQGTKVKKLLVSPLTDYILKLADMFYSGRNVGSEEMDSIQKEMFIRERTDVLKLSKDVYNGKLDERINKFICPHLQMDMDKFKALKQDKRVPALEFDKDYKDVQIKKIENESPEESIEESSELSVDSPQFVKEVQKAIKKSSKKVSRKKK